MQKRLLFLLLLIVWQLASSQDYAIRTTEDGLPSNNIYCIKQDINGFIWFGTNRGIAKYDGAKFTIFTVKNGLPNNDIWHLETDNYGRVWYMSKSKYQGYIENDSVHKYITEDSLVISPNTIFNNGKKIWLGNYTLKNDCFSNSTEPESTHQTKNEWFYSLNKDSTRTIFYPDKNQTILIETNKVLVFNEALQQRYEIQLNEEINPENLAPVYYGSIANNTCFVGLKKGLLFLNLSSRFARYNTYNELIQQETVTAMQCTVHGDDIQVSTPNHLLIFDANFQLVQQYFFNKSLRIEHSFIDQNGNVWGASMSQGCYFMSKAKTDTKYYLKGKKVSKLGRIGSSIFAGIDMEGFFEMKEKSDSFTLSDELRTDAEIYQIKYQHLSKRGYLVAYNDIFICDEKRTDIFRKEKLGIKNSASLGSKDIIDLRNQTYVITSTNLIVQDNSNALSPAIFSEIGLSSLIEFKGDLFIGGNDGLQVFKNQKLTQPTQKHPLFNVPIRTMLSTQSNLIVGTDGRGVYFYGQGILPIKSTDGLIIQRIIKKDNQLWLATQNGVKVLTLDEKNISDSQITNGFNKSDGLIQDNVNDIFFKDSFLFAASDLGIARINLNSPLFKQTPDLFFETNSDTLVLDYDQSKYVSISFSVLSFSNQKNIRFQYKLAPLNKDWISTTERTLNFSYLAPNFYTLQVKAIDQHGNQKIRTQYILVQTQWWQTSTFKVLIIFFILIIFSLVIRIIYTRLQKKEAYKTEQNRRIANVELQALRSQMNPHFVHNSLNAIQYYIEKNEVEVSQTYLSKFSTLIRLFFEHSKSKNLSIRNEVKLLTNYLEIEKLRFDEKLNFEIIIHEKIDLDEQFIPAMLLQPIVENAVNHGLFHKPGNGFLSIKFDYISDQTFRVEVYDNGIGINKGKQISLNAIQNSQSRSTDVLKERLDLLKQNNDWDILYETRDISDYENDTGTIVKLTFTQL